MFSSNSLMVLRREDGENLVVIPFLTITIMYELLSAASIMCSQRLLVKIESKEKPLNDKKGKKKEDQI